MNDFSSLEKLAKVANAVTGDVRVEMTIASDAGPNQAEIDAVTAFMGVATPAAVLELITERDQLFGITEQLKAENERLRKLPTCWTEVLEQSEANDQLLDQVLELSKYADRWKWLEGSADSATWEQIGHQEHMNRHLHVDAAMSKESK